MGDNTHPTVRSLTRADEPHWRRLWSAYLAFYEAEVREEVYLTTFSRLLSDDEPQHGLIAETGGQPVGLVQSIFRHHNWKIEDVCYPKDLHTDPAARRRGVGRALIAAVYAAADRKGSPAVHRLTQTFNSTARELHDRIGRVTPFIKYQRG